ncbi:MAG: M23 family metallopeptidase [Clostridia bacterium]|nr:M23 family metallopeptidase [Clostridia bacterium]
MKNENKKNNAQKKANSGFYIVLSLCLVAVGVAAWSVTQEFSGTEPNLEYSEPDNSYTEITEIPEAPVDSNLTDIEYDEPEPQDTPASTTPEIPTAEYFLMPIEGNIIKVYDNVTLQYSATLGDMRLHTGIDIAATGGSAVKSAGDGTVTEIYNDAALGTVVVIDHGNSVVAKYCGLENETAVKSGDTVKAGTELGTLGIIPIESADESHLHFEIFEGGTAVSPLQKMGMEN